MTQPFVHTVSLGLGIHAGIPAAEMLEHLRSDALLAEKVGFDGVTLSEHHAGHPGYVPAPLLICATLLGSLGEAWACASPLLLPLRPVRVVAEEVAWLAAGYPGRVGIGVAPGYHKVDYDVVGRDFRRRAELFWSQLGTFVSLLQGADELAADDPALIACRAHPLPVISTVNGPRNAERAAVAGAGILTSALRPYTATRDVIATHARAGGPPHRVVVCRLKIGGVRRELTLAIDEVFRSRQGEGESWLPPPDVDDIIAGEPQDVADELITMVRTTGATGLNLRVHMVGEEPSAVRRQIERVGTEVVPLIREALRWGRAPVVPGSDGAALRAEE
jgi:alkanesulfonate monooxygenase SsuD/methylene tetrahydromethanopterin reductase-like flavin-dependent oxidoreductase (luciferase family)